MKWERDLTKYAAARQCLDLFGDDGTPLGWVMEFKTRCLYSLWIGSPKFVDVTLAEAQRLLLDEIQLSEVSQLA